MVTRIRAYIAIAALILFGFAIGKTQSRREVVYVVREGLR